MYLVKSPLLLQWYYPSLTWHQSRSEKTVYLTFDDGPIPNVTDFVLNTLNNFGAKATFFCIGDNIKKHPHIFDRIKQEGHQVGNHTFHHLRGWDTPDETYVDDFLACQALTASHVFRPPYGRIKKSQVKKITEAYQNAALPTQLPIQIVMWDVLSGDFDLQLSPEKCYTNVINHVKNGSIIVFHDSLKAFDRLAYALPKVLQHLSDKGYHFGTF